MEASESILESIRQERRRNPRFPVEEPATLILVKQGSSLTGHLVNLSLEGCRLHMDQRFVGGILVRVEVVLQVCGQSLRIPGVTQWTDSRHCLGVRFVDMNARRREALSEMIGEAVSGFNDCSPGHE